MIKTACGLDCPDACGIVVEPNYFPKVVADSAHPTSNGALCSLINRYIHKEPRITKARVGGIEVSLDTALEAIKESLQVKEKLLWRGSGNFGVMQEITNLLFDKIDGTTTKGSLCDGAGDVGIVEGRGVNRILPPQQIAKADVVVVWGKNISVTSSHLMPYLKGKKIIVIDPIETAIAKRADLFLQIMPRSDFYMAIMLARFAFMGDHEDREYLDEFAPEYEDFYDFSRGFRVKAVLEYIGVDLQQMGELLEYLTDNRVVFLVGNGVQKYSTGNFVLQAIDALAVILGHFGKEGSGVAFLGNSKLGFENPFEIGGKKVQKATTNFRDFDTVLIQGGNPVASMPNSGRVIEELKKTKTIIYFGLYENETSAMADIVLPAKNFFEKEDIRLSYAHHIVSPMRKVVEAEYGISEYEFTNTLLQKFGFDALDREEKYLNLWLKQCRKEDGYYLSPAYQETPYEEGFGDEDDEFEFIEDFYDDFESSKRLTRVRKRAKRDESITEFWLVTPKAKNALNTQFTRDNQITLHPSLGFRDGEEIIASTKYGEYQFIVKNSNSMRMDTVLIYANAIGVNYLTPSILSEEGNSACYQEVKIILNSI
ncbi:Anaerobic dehydrogenases, typically selenocysteine-containing [hydrothermal vent metagenome]|uniref:Anaerobic dehydrogenases, typically selenocysteine-containing n=1 Tax=hydrothermal vent metagenome TaxID=652676 RepID=A0A1W1BWB9_9ZZZZ